MFYFSYMLNELRRRAGRTLLTALGLGVGVGLVIVVNALSTGLDDAQNQVLRPLTGIGTDMSVSRPISISDAGAQNGRPQLSDEERQQLEAENGPRRVGLQDLGNPGDTFTRDTFMSAAQLSFPASTVPTIGGLAGVSSAAGGLTLNSVHIEGVVPDQPQGGFRTPGGGGGGGGPDNIDFTSITVTGVDSTNTELGAITPARITEGSYFASGDAREAVLNVSYARTNEIAVGDTIKLGGKTFTVVGLAQTPLGGQASDVYVKLGQLQALSDRAGRVNTVYVRANSAEQVGALARHISSAVDGASVTTAKDIADRVSGSLVDAKNVTSKLGLALSIVALLSAFLIAGLLTLASVTKRVRELGTLKALGWSQRLVVRQVTGEALLQGLLGAALGIGIGLAGAVAIGALAPSLEATVQAAAAPALGRFGPGGPGATTAAAAATTVDVTAPVSAALMLLAAGLALAGGLFSGVVGGLRAARLRPADALRHID
jgi:ABC-type antimicrobial peptide transport system permease subunit